MENIREIAEMHYQQETKNNTDEKYKQSRINALEKLLTEQLNIAFVSKQRELLIAFSDKWNKTPFKDQVSHIYEGAIDIFFEGNL